MRSAEKIDGRAANTHCSDFFDGSPNWCGVLTFSPWGPDMRLLRFLRRHPLTLLGAIAVAFIGWIWWDAIPARDPAPEPVVPGVFDTNGRVMIRQLPRPPLSATVDAPPDVTAGL